MSQVDFFDSVAKNWDNMIEVNESKINYILSKLKLKEDDTILDVSTGTGVLIPFLIKLSPNGLIRGVDISKGMLDIACEKFKKIPNVHFDLVDVEDENIESKYDKIILYSMYPHLEDKTNTISKLVKNNLRNNGILMIAHSNSRKFLNNLHKNADERVNESLLMEVSKQKEVFINASLNVIEAFEDDEMYYIVIQNS
ncbi:class I SAM-dependent methyltransferase [Romboutsia sp. 1001713B170207_170306_H8]|uniref:class I SAM-dependent methyltransferase n=1 Tax=Romboutsia sp. 1001713B170207_170306_H8 TaxID=2787112 RepID=UPI000823249D|nr:methyltransferase domain-containing protein [Romboutsia sp. 1001713B170207_170306_H8]SCH49612.1 Cyclopropane-fatty-acyl-phospholipid synthase [uncultured Clostridium sp.]